MEGRLIDRIRAIAEWEQAHPEIARSWNEALAEKRYRERAEHLNRHLAEQDARAPAFLRSCGLEDREIAVLLSPMRRTKAMEAVAQYLTAWDDPKKRRVFLLLAGEVGCGKTVAAASLFLTAGKNSYEVPDLGRVWGWQDRSCAYVLAPDLARTGVYGDEERREEARLKACRALVIDELGAEIHTEIWLSRLEELINARYRHVQLPTILCTNLDHANFKTRYGDRITRRLRDAGMTPKLAVEAEDRRVAS